MRVSVRQLIVLMLIAMIPMKGFAAASMMFCGLSHDRAAVVASERMVAAAGAHQQHGQAAPPCHVEVIDELTDAPGTPAFDISCSLCAACSATGAIAEQPAPQLSAPLSSGPWIASIDGFAGHISPPLDRPPL